MSQLSTVGDLGNRPAGTILVCPGIGHVLQTRKEAFGGRPLMPTYLAIIQGLPLQSRTFLKTVSQLTWNGRDIVGLIGKRHPPLSKVSAKMGGDSIGCGRRMPQRCTLLAKAPFPMRYAKL